MLHPWPTVIFSKKHVYKRGSYITFSFWLTAGGENGGWLILVVEVEPVVCDVLTHSWPRFSGFRHEPSLNDAIFTVEPSVKPGLGREKLLPRHAWCGSRGSKYFQHRKDLPTGCKRLEIQGIGRVSRTPVDLEKGGPTKKWLKNGIPQCTHETGHFVIIYTSILQQ